MQMGYKNLNSTCNGQLIRNSSENISSNQAALKQMTTNNTLTGMAPFRHLTQLTAIRHILLACLWSSITIGFWFDETVMPFEALLIVLTIFSSIHFLTYLRLRNNIVVTELEFFIQLLIDVTCLITLFYFSSGANNPFVSYLLVPICISAATLPWKFTWAITSLCLVAYTGLLFLHVDIPFFEITHHNASINWHVWGMWFNFFISATLITYFVVKMARTLHQQDEILSDLREDELRNQQLMAVAMLAAGAAHEMNTPLSTMTVLLSELQEEYKGNPLLVADLNILSQQVKHCACTLKHLVQDSNEAHEGIFKQQPIKTFCESIINRWQLMRPNVNFTLTFNNQIQNAIVHDPRLDYAIINLLNNAADENPNNIQLQVECEHNQLVWKIIDSGKGINSQIGSKLGKIMLSTKEQGLGIGLLLAYATIKHHGGKVTQTPGVYSGTITELRLPLAQ